MKSVKEMAMSTAVKQAVKYARKDFENNAPIQTPLGIEPQKYSRSDNKIYLLILPP